MKNLFINGVIMKSKYVYLLFALFLLVFVSCNEDSDQPATIGGDTNLDLTQVGNKYDVSLNIDGNTGLLNGVKDSVNITQSENGNITVKAHFIFNLEQVKYIDTLFGLQGVSNDIKKTYVDAYISKWGAKLDTTNKDAMTYEIDLKGRVTSEGIQEYIHGNGNTSKPFTIVKYGDAVGTKYEFTSDDGKKIVRTITSKAEVEDYYLTPFLSIKSIKVEEVKEDPLIEKVTYITNHKFGLVGIKVNMKTGKIINVSAEPLKMTVPSK